MPPLPAGTVAPDFSLPDARGAMQTLQGLAAGGPIVLAFYKSECPTCALTFPFLEKLRLAYPSLPLVGIAQNDAAEASRFAATYEVGFPQLIDDPFYFTSAAYQIDFTPTLFLVDAGRIAGVVEAWSRERWNELSRRLAERLARPYVELSSPDDGAPDFRPG